MAKITIAAAQIVPEKGDTLKNAETHEKLISKAAEKGVDLIVFPELSLTGYEPELANELAYTIYDERLKPLIRLSEKFKMIVIVGAPFRLEATVYIGAFVIFPNNSVAPYAKHYLHGDEAKVFSPGYLNPKIYLGEESASIAVCADISHPEHAVSAAKAGSTLYLTSVFITPEGYDKDSAILRKNARKYNMAVVMANFGSNSGGLPAAGKSAIWSESGAKVVGMEGVGEGLVIAKKVNGSWTGKILQ